LTEPEISEVRARRRSTQVRVPHAEPDAEADEAADVGPHADADHGEPLGRADAGADVRAVALAERVHSDAEPEPAVGTVGTVGLGNFNSAGCLRV
jgi:hypothetical protein